MKPTLQIYGTGNRYTQDGKTKYNQSLLDRVSPAFAFKWRGEQSFSPVFSFTGEVAAADALLFLPDCDLFSVFAAIAEKEVDNPFTQHKHDRTRELPNNRKPIVFLGSKEDWRPVKHIIDELSKHGTIRGDVLGKTVHFSETVDDAMSYIKANIPADISNRRAENCDHKMYIDEKDAVEDFIQRDENTPKAKHAVTIAFFGSATTKHEKHKALGRAASQACAENGWNEIHGGGVGGVMGALTEGGEAAGVYVHGITATNKYAMYLSGEKDPKQIVPKGQARFTSGKDMIHRIELYAKNSEALVALPGGVGTLEEITLTLELLEEKHNAVMYEDTFGQQVKKPMILVNQDGIWDSLIAYYHNPERPDLQKSFDENIMVVSTIAEMNTTLKRHFEAHPPKTFAIDHVDETIKTTMRQKILTDRQGSLFPEETTVTRH